MPSFASTLLERGLSSEEEYEMKMAAVSMFGGGTDTVRCAQLFDSFADKIFLFIDCIGHSFIHTCHDPSP